MDWGTVGVNATIIGGAASALGFAVKRWITQVDARLEEFGAKIHGLELSLAEKYVPKNEFDTRASENSASHKNLWEEYRSLQKDTRDRLAVLETLAKAANGRKRKV